MTTKPYSIETHSGARLTLGSFDPDKIIIEDIAHALAMQCRYNGHCDVFYSVAEHSVHVCQFLKKVGYSLRQQLLGLLHDAAEAYIGDIITPVKDAVPQIRELEEHIITTIWTGLKITPPTGTEIPRTKLVDELLLATEANVLMPSRGANWGLRHKPDPEITLKFHEHHQAKAVFLATYRTLRT